MIRRESTDNFLAETEVEESLMLMGRVNALRGIWEIMPDQIDAKIVNAIFNFGPQENEEVTQAKKDKAMYWDWYMSETRKNEEHQKKIDSLQRQIDSLMAEKEADDGNTV